MKKAILVATISIIGIVFVASIYGGYNLIYSAKSPFSTPSPNSVSPTPSAASSTATPVATPTPSPSSQNQNGSSALYSPTMPYHIRGPSEITVLDNTGASVTVALPVKRIVALTMLSTVYILGAGDRVVGRGYMTPDDIAISPLPSWLLEKPDVGTDWSPNMELIIELKPDLVLASLRLSDANRKKLEDAGIAVIEDTLMWPRRYDCIRNLGLILEAETKAEELIGYELYYVNLVEARVTKLPRAEKPLVFFEWYRPWFSAGRGSTYEVMIVTAGGINIAENVTVVAPQLSAEWVAENNPDIIIRMSTYLDGVDLVAFQQLWNDIMNRPGVSYTNAVKNRKVYIARDSILVGAEVIGLLYYAKWFHPNLFQDIDPTAIHEAYIQKFFGTKLKGVYAYP